MNDDKIDLQILSNYGSKEEMDLKDVSEETILKVMNDLDWNNFHQLMLGRSNGEWIEVSGNLKEDGLSSNYGDNDKLFCIKEAPNSIQELSDILISFCRKDGEFKRIHTYKDEYADQRKPIKQDYNKWHKEYHSKLKKENYQKGTKVFLTVLIFILFSSFLYYSAIGELQFIFQNTEFTEATVVETKMYHIGKGRYLQTVWYEFEYEDKTYKDSFRAGRFVGKREVGDRIKIKFSTSNPNRSSMMEVYEKKRRRLNR